MANLLTKLSSQNNVHGKGHEMCTVKTRERQDTERYNPTSLISKIFKIFTQILKES